MFSSLKTQIPPCMHRMHYESAERNSPLWNSFHQDFTWIDLEKVFLIHNYEKRKVSYSVS